jgi:hypothetical protein
MLPQWENAKCGLREKPDSRARSSTWSIGMQDLQIPLHFRESM